MDKIFDEQRSAFQECMDLKKLKVDIEVRTIKAHKRLRMATDAVRNLEMETLMDMERKDLN